jgi:uncharacterized protein YkwD
MKKVIFTTIAVLTLIFAFNASAALTNWDILEQDVFELVNMQRAHNGLSALTADDRLQRAADLHSEDMAVNDYFNHNSQDGTPFYDRITAQKYSWTACGENIAVGQENAYQVMFGTDDLMYISDFSESIGNSGFSTWDDVGSGWSGNDWNAWWGYTDQMGGWMGSQGHRQNILNDYFTDIGIGYYYLETDTGDLIYHHYWTQDFAAGDTVPVPSAILLLGGGLIGIVGLRRHNSQVS